MARNSKSALLIVASKDYEETEFMNTKSALESAGVIQARSSSASAARHGRRG